MPHRPPFPPDTKKASQAGFTLVELVLTLIIVGVLAAIAAPRLLNLSKDARIASIQGLEAAIRSQVHVLQMKCMIVPACSTKINETAQYSAGVNAASNGLLVDMVYGIPRQTAINTSIAGLLNAVPKPGYSADGTMAGFNVTVDTGGYDAGGVITFKRSDVPDPETCKVTYTPGQWGTSGWTAPWNSSYHGGDSNHLATVPLEQRYNVSSVTTGC